MIIPVGQVQTVPAHAPVAPPAVAPVAPAATVSTHLEQGHDRPGRDGGSGFRSRSEAGRQEQALSSPPEPVSTQAVLLLRQNGTSVASIAEAYGISVESVRKLLHVGQEEAERATLAGAAARD